MHLRKDPILREYDAWLDEALRPVREMRARSLAKREAAEKAAAKPKRRKPSDAAAKSPASDKRQASGRTIVRAKKSGKR
jgi:hypothetical protein